MSDEAKSGLCSLPGGSPNGGSVAERVNLHKRYSKKLRVEPELTRQLVSFQGNRNKPGLRWFRYKEGFSQALVERFLDSVEAKSLLDPFAGAGTAPLIAAGRGIPSMGIDISPVGTLAAGAIAIAANGVSKSDFRTHGDKLLASLDRPTSPPKDLFFRHVAITEGAFSEETERKLASARLFLLELEKSNPDIATLLNAACVSILEAISYTRKDGQYLRWDSRSPRQLKSRMNKGYIPTVEEALSKKLTEIEDDFVAVKKIYGGTSPEFITGSSLDVLKDLKSSSVELVITSPPYANRYDYTRTYALELAWMGYDRSDFSRLRQAMISATVENKSKQEWLEGKYRNSKTYDCAIHAYNDQLALKEVLDILSDRQGELSNPNILRLIEGYFREMAVIISELGRIVKPGGHVVMVNDNVQYHGEEIPVDLILTDIAERSGFICKRIEVLPRGKGNASQQMGKFGRRELRKCVYIWKR